MSRGPVDNLELERSRALTGADALVPLAVYAKQDGSFAPHAGHYSTTCQATAGQSDFELFCTGPKFWDTRANRDRDVAINLAICLQGNGFTQATQLLRSKGL